VENSLKHAYISVIGSNYASYGGSQLMSSHKYMRECGCGVVACCDLLLYLCSISNPKADIMAYFSGNNQVMLDKYDELLLKMSHGYFPIVPPFGMTGISLAAGLNIFFAINRMNYFAVWDIAKKTIFSNIRNMLSDDIPVILSVGPNFPKFWDGKKITLFRKEPSGEFRPAYLAKAHFVTVTGMDDTWLRISSWGKELYLKRSDFSDYITQYSNFIVSNICLIKKTSRST